MSKIRTPNRALLALAASAGMSLEQLAEHACVSLNVLHNATCGRKRLPDWARFQLAAAFGLQPDSLMEISVAPVTWIGKPITPEHLFDIAHGSGMRAIACDLRNRILEALEALPLGEAQWEKHKDPDKLVAQLMMAEELAAEARKPYPVP